MKRGQKKRPILGIPAEITAAPEKDTEKVIDWKHEKTGRIRKYQHGEEIEHAKPNLPLLISHAAAKRAIADGYKKAKDEG